jgi:2-polyprenyl-3-methyl-5-hydroxy-6-metoxy-1,4-benzoquinol methylase
VLGRALSKGPKQPSHAPTLSQLRNLVSLELGLHPPRHNQVTNTQYDPQRYWETRLSADFSLKAVGHIGFSRGYNTWLYRRKRSCIERCLRDVTLQGRSVLDVGCGTGFFVKWYLEKGAEVCGIDITRTSIEQLSRRFRAEFHTQDISAKNYVPIKRFDIVNMWDVIYHIVAPDDFTQAFRTNQSKDWEYEVL